MARVKASKVVDGIHYKSLSLVNIHNELRANKRVKSFTLPNISNGVKKSKYGSYKAEINGFIFDSVMEGRYYVYLLDELHKNNIKSFDLQVKFNLLPKGRNKFKNKAILETNYIADFVITRLDDTKLVVDIKGKKTADFKIKEKIFMLKYPDLEFKCIQLDSHTKQWRDLDDIRKDASKRKKAKLKKG